MGDLKILGVGNVPSPLFTSVENEGTRGSQAGTSVVPTPHFVRSPDDPPQLHRVICTACWRWGARVRS